MFDSSHIETILSSHSVEARTVTAVNGSPSVFFANDDLVLHLSETQMGGRLKRHRRVESLPFVPRLRFSGSIDSAERTIHYVAEDLLPGKNLIDAWGTLSEDQQVELGSALAGTLESLHRLEGSAYDIGHYVPTVPSFQGSWQEGHARYWEILFVGIARLSFSRESRAVLEKAQTVLQSLRGVLCYESGPRLLHNDLHPRNILAADGQLSGVVDWECSQFGEADFELSHLVHWCAFPPRPTIDLRGLIRSLLYHSPSFLRHVPELVDRLTVYQIEHDINQLIWSRGTDESERISRLRRWLDGGVADVVRAAEDPPASS